jgi:hypothetical protein
VKRIYFRIAAEKAKTPAAHGALQALAELAAAYEDADASFPLRINASKAARGEKPTDISPSMREKLSSLEADRTALDDDLARQFSALPDSESIVRALHHAMSSELPTAEKNLKYFHPSDLPIGKDIVERKSQLVAAMASFLANHSNEA